MKIKIACQLKVGPEMYTQEHSCHLHYFGRQVCTAAARAAGTLPQSGGGGRCGRSQGVNGNAEALQHPVNPREADESTFPLIGNEPRLAVDRCHKSQRVHVLATDASSRR